MGYLPKHHKVRRQQHILRTIARAALAGATFSRVVDDTNVRWRVWYDGDLQPRSYWSRFRAAEAFLKWFSMAYGIPLPALKVKA